MKVGSTLLTNRARRGFTMTDLCVLIAVGALLFAVIVPTLRINANEVNNRIKCAANLRTIALASLMYAGQDARNNGKFSRTYYDNSRANKPQVYTGVDAPVAFDPAGEGPNGVKANDVTAGFYNLLKTQDLTADYFVCPSSEAIPL